MTETDKMTIYMSDLEDTGIDISEVTNTHLLMGYYSSLGVTITTTMSQFFHDINRGYLPAYETVTRSIRKSRELTPRWKKHSTKVEAEIEHTKEEVGY